MADPLEGLTSDGTIRTGASLDRVPQFFAPILRAAAEHMPAGEVSLYGYGSVTTGQALPHTSDVDLLTIGVTSDEATAMSVALSDRFASQCRGVEVAAAQPGDFDGDFDEAYGNRVFLRHYCVLLGGSDRHRPLVDFPGDARAIRGFNGDIAQHARRWRQALDGGVVTPDEIARRLARKTLLAVAGLVSMHDATWTTDRTIAAERWSVIEPEHGADITLLLSWTSGARSAQHDEVIAMLDNTVAGVVERFEAHIGLWPD